MLAELDARRGTALAGPDLAGLASFAQEGSAAWQADVDVIEQLRERGLRPVGLATKLVAIEDVSEPEPQAEGAQGAVAVTLVDKRSEYQLVDGDGQTVQTVPASGRKRWRTTLVRVEEPAPDPGWRVSSVEVVAA